MDEIIVGDRVEYRQPRYGDPPPCFGTVERVLPGADRPFFVRWDDGTRPYPSNTGSGFYPKREIRKVAAMEDDMIPVIDEQEFDWEAEQSRIQRCVTKLRLLKQRCVTKENRATVEEAIDLLLAYEDDLEGER